jgi:hypothetical protein
VDLLRPNAKFQSFGGAEAQQYQIGFDDFILSLGLSTGEVRIATLLATSNGYSTEPILVTLSPPESITQEIGNDAPIDEEFSEETHLYSSVVWDKNSNKNWMPFKVNAKLRKYSQKEASKEPHCTGPFGSYLSVYEDEEPRPQPHDKHGFSSFVFRTRERCLCDVSMILPSMALRVWH